MHPNLQYLHRTQIDTQKWDRCIAHAANGLLYAHSFYLDHMADNWDALVLGDYEAVMPLTWRRKFGISYLYQPFVTASLGVFSALPIDEALIKTFIDHIPGKFRLIDIDLNAGNNALSGRHVTPRKNYELKLDASYPLLQEQYNRHARRKLKKANEARLTITEDVDVETIAELSFTMMKEKDAVPKADYDRFVRLYKGIRPQVEACNTMAALNANGSIIASDINIVYNKRVYSLLAGNTSGSNENGGFYFVLDQLIKKYAGTGYVLDFEGSDIAGIAFLFECLGAQLTWYPHITINRLPPILRKLKMLKYQ
ncbi:GNAT family N-acetyltransferase [Niastella sp. OAS944]|uniref:GNAT family N-acetyltransferase n=1 Tax=Niastella sp. OAS944 TaxID=2664089 RepID=UPI003481B689|nr:hypothetical protein [Chitinophagaceae bacterium OAS944]